MLAQQFHTAVAAARTGPELDELARGLWRAHAEGRLADADAQALSEAIKARGAALAAKAAGGHELGYGVAPTLRAAASVARLPVADLGRSVRMGRPKSCLPLRRCHRVIAKRLRAALHARDLLRHVTHCNRHGSGRPPLRKIDCKKLYQPFG